MADQNTQFYAILTNVGAAKQANADALGIPWKITQLGVGDANGTDPTPNATQTRLINEWRRAPLNQLKVDDKNNAVIVAEQVIPAEVGGKWIREIALYDDAGDMIAVANCPPTYKPLLSQGSGRTQVVRMNLIVSNSSNVQLKIDPSVVLATREFVDLRLSEEIGKLDAKVSVRAATVGAIDLGGIPTLDGVLLQAGDRVLVKNQLLGRENGIYVVGSGLWSRSTDADSNAEVTPGLLVMVEQGSLQADTLWKLVTDAPIVLGTTPLTFQNATTGYNGTSPRSSGGAISPAEAGKMIYFFGTEPGQTLTLPSASSLPVGATVNVQNVSSVAVTLAKIGADQIQIGGEGGLIDNLVLYPGSELEFTCSGPGDWFAQGTGALHRMAGMPTLPPGSSRGQLATDAFVQQELKAERGAAPPLMAGVASPGIATKKSREDHRHPTDTSRAPLESPAFTGLPTAPTPALTVNNAQIATTAFVSAAVAALVNAAPGALDTLNELAAALGNDPNFAATMNYYLSLKAPLVSPALGGSPTTPTAQVFDDSLQIANTAFVRRHGGQFGGVSGYTAGGQLPVTDAGKLVYFAGSTAGQVLSLPAAANIAMGGRISVQNVSSFTIAVARTSGDFLHVGGEQLTGLSIPPGGEATFTRANVAAWYVTGSATLGKVASFASLKAPNGWEQLPSGIIRQWGTAANGDMANGTLIVLPTTYPNEHLITVACAVNTTGEIESAYVGDQPLNGFRLFTQSQPSAGGAWNNSAVSARYISLGW